MSVFLLMPSVLFVCTGNLYRSPLAAAFLRRLLQEHNLAGWKVESAGTWTAPQQRLPQDALRYAQLLGLDLEEHRTRVVDGGMLNDFDLILVMEKGHKEALKSEFPAAAGRVRQLAEMVEGDPFDIPDPVRFPSVAKRDRVLDDMLKVVERGFPRITELAPSRARSRR